MWPFALRGIPDSGYGASNSTFQTVGVASAIILRANPRRKSLLLVNTSPNMIYLSKDRAAALGSGIPLYPNGGHYGEPDNRGAVWLGQWYAIANVVGSNLAITEDW